MRRFIAALQVSVDGFIEGPNGSAGLGRHAGKPFDLSGRIDACVLGQELPGLRQYWRAILANPKHPAVHG